MQLKGICLIIVILLLPIGIFAKEIILSNETVLWVDDSIFRFFAVSPQECTLKDGTTYINSLEQCRMRYDCYVTSDGNNC